MLYLTYINDKKVEFGFIYNKFILYTNIVLTLLQY